MKKACLLFFAWSASVLAATTVAETNWRNVQGVLVNGYCDITPVAEFSSVNGWRISGVTVRFSISYGQFSASLVPTDTSTPQGQYYNAVCKIGNSTTNRIWLVPTTTNVLHISDVEQVTPPPGPVGLGDATSLRGNQLCSPLMVTDAYVLTWTAASGCASFKASSGGSGVPSAPVNSVQYNNAGAFGADSGFTRIVSTTAPSAPVLATVGTPGVTTLGYKLVFRTPTGTSAASAETTIATANAVLDGTNYVTVTAPACSIVNTTVDVYLTTAGGNVPDTGYLDTIACGATYLHQGLDGNFTTPPSVDTTKGVFVSSLSHETFLGHMAIGAQALVDSDSLGDQLPAIVTLAETLDAGLWPDLDNNSGNVGGVDARFTFLNSGAFTDLAAFGLVNLNTIGPGSATPFRNFTALENAGTVLENVTNNAWMDYNSLVVGSGVTIGGDVYQRYNTHFNLGGTVSGTWYADYSADLSTAGGVNRYYRWDDSRGVGRCKEDNTFDAVGQSICVVYNPQFAKYTPGAADFERIVYGQWNGNVAEMGAEKGGTGTLRVLRFIGASVELPGTSFLFDGKTCTIVAGAIACS